MTSRLFSMLNWGVPVALGVAIASLPSPASALTLNSSAGSWGTVIGQPNGLGGYYDPVYDYVSAPGEAQVRWGVPMTTAGPSGLGFAGVGLTDLEPGNVFTLGTLRHFNNVVEGGTAASGVAFNLTLDFLELGMKSFNFNLSIDETPNDPATCPYYSVIPCSDRISWTNTISEQSFVFEGATYTLELLGFRQSFDTGIVRDFISQEGGTNAATLYARLRAVPSDPISTPEPMSLLGLGLLALVGSRQVRR